MHKRTSTCGVCVLAIVFAAAATDLWAQDGQRYTPSYSAADQAPRPRRAASRKWLQPANRRPSKIGLPTIVPCRQPRTTRTRIWRNVFPTWRSSWRTTPKRRRRPSPKRRPSL